MSAELHRSDVPTRLELVGVHGRERAALRSAAAATGDPGGWAERLQAAAATLDAMLRRHPEIVGTATPAGSAARLAGVARRSIEGVVDGEYAGAASLGVEHRRAGLSPGLLVEAVGFLVAAQVETLFATVPDHLAARDAAVALVGDALVVVGLALDAHGAARERTSGTERLPATSDRPLTARRAEQRRWMLGLDAPVVEALRTLTAVIPQAVPMVSAGYAEVLRAHPALEGLRRLAARPASVQRATVYWQELVTGAFDRPYAVTRLHAEVDLAPVGVAPSLAIAGLAHHYAGIARGVRAEPRAMAAVVGALSRAVFFDASFLADSCVAERAPVEPLGAGVAEAFLAALAEPLVVVDAAGRVRHANRPMLDLLGREASAVHGVALHELVADDDVADLVVRARTASAPEPRIVELGGRSRRISATRLGNADRSGRGADVAVLFVDVTDLASRAPAPAMAEQRVDQLLSAVPAVLWELDIASTTLRAVSTPVVDLTGHRDVAFIGRPGAWIDLIPEPERARFVQLCETLRPGETAELDHHLTRADGTELVVCSHLRRTTERDAATIAGVTYDVDVRRADQDRRLASIAVLAGGVAHELNNALSAVYGNLELLGRSVTEPRAVRSVAAAEGAAARAADITTRLLTFAGRQVLRPEVVDLTELVREVVPIDGPPGGLVTVEVAGDAVPWPCRVDRSRLAAALGEIVVNAFEAMPDGGALRISVRNVRGSALDRADESFGIDQVELAVHDTGVGMSAAVRARATEPFFTTKEFGESAGLGLSTVYGFVAQSGGSLLVESAPGAGTTVRIRFPRDRTVHYEPSLAMAGRAPGGSLLLVDDDPMVREVTSELLGVLGVRVCAVSSAEQAVAVATHEPIDVLLADIALGAGLDGVALINELRAKAPDLAVIVVSGHPEVQLGLDRVDGPYEYLRKPFTLDALRAALRAVGWSAHVDR